MTNQALVPARKLLFFIAVTCLFLSESSFSQEAKIETPALNFDAPVIEQKKEDAFSLSPWSHLTPSLDLRFVLLFKSHPATGGRQGLGLMQAIAGINWAISKDAQIVTRYNLGFLGQGVREVYIDFSNYYFDSLKVGRFSLPFGLLLSDHRVYSKRFFGVSINDFESGISAQKSYGFLQTSVSFVQGLGSGEAFQNNEILYTPAVDVRFDSNMGEVQYTAGMSAFQTLRSKGKENSKTDNSKALVAFLRATYNKFVLSTESVWGYKRSAQTQGLADFTGSPAYVSDLGKSSWGLYLSPEYSLSRKWKILYQYDQVVLDTRYHADRFEKHGLAAKWAFSESADLETRVEFLKEGRRENPDLRSDNNDALITLHAWF